MTDVTTQQLNLRHLHDAMRIGAFAAPDTGIRLEIPANDTPDPELSIVIPAMNECITIAEFILWCREGMESAGVRGEILIVDSSTDQTPQIALSLGARVLRTPKRGLGRAYIDAIPFIRGKYVLMGDADCTYDFRHLGGFVEQFRAGAEFILGSRFKGSIEPGSMPPLHQYFGTPFTTQILNTLYSTHFSDIHCGMRGISTEALVRINLESQSWEYASEMVLKSVCLGLKTAEVPVRFLKDKEGRLSHMKRGGWLEPWRAGWINLRAMLLYGADFFLLKPGLVLLAVGLAILLPASLGPVRIGPVTLMLHWMLLGLTLSVVGLQSAYLGCIVQVMYGYSETLRAKRLRQFSYNRMMSLSAGAAALGLAAAVPLARQYIQLGLRLPEHNDATSHIGVTGLLLFIGAFLTFSSTLVMHAVAVWTQRSARV
ncbi:MAG TPA: glycosyltransferase family 2 protein [Paludibaculum sp.]|jgi:hypothetical protein